MAPATEIVYLPLKEGRYPDDVTSVPGQQFKGLLETILAQDGAQGLYWGRQVENPPIANIFIDWDSIDHHTKFTESAVYKEFFSNFQSFQDGNLIYYHVHFEPHPPAAALSNANAIVTEFITLYFPADYSKEDQEKLDQDLKKFGDIIAGSTEDCKGSAGGWVEEELDLPDSSEKAKVYILLIGWTSVAAHLQYREAQAFKDNIYLLRGAKNLKAVKVVHVPAKEVRKA